MSSTGPEPASGPAALLDTYARNVASRAAQAGSVERYIHFGHWDGASESPPSKAELPAAQERLDERLRSLAGLRDGLRVLDAGCGFGGTLAAIDAGFERMRLVGLNLDPRQLSLATATVSPREGTSLEWVCGDASELAGFGDATFDRVLAVESVVHFASRRAFLRAAARVMDRGGRLALSDFAPTEELRALRGSPRIPFDVDRVVASGLRPWPDFWGEDADYDVLAAACGLRVLERIDATEATLPSYRAILGDVVQGEHVHPCDEGMLLLEWLQTRGLMQMVYLSFEAVGA